MNHPLGEIIYIQGVSILECGEDSLMPGPSTCSAVALKSMRAKEPKE